jgi:hypothetical protein
VYLARQVRTEGGLSQGLISFPHKPLVKLTLREVAMAPISCRLSCGVEAVGILIWVDGLAILFAMRIVSSRKAKSLKGQSNLTVWVLPQDRHSVLS